MILDLSKITSVEVSCLRNGEGNAFVRKHIEGDKTFLEITLPPDSSIGLHTHVDDEEIIYVIRGSGINIEFDQTYPIQAGNIIYIKQSQNHQIVNNSDADLVILGIIQK